MASFMVIKTMSFLTKEVASKYKLLPSNEDEKTSVKANSKYIFHGHIVVMVTLFSFSFT